MCTPSLTRGRVKNKVITSRDQNNANNAYYVARTVTNNNKTYSYAVLPFYEFLPYMDKEYVTIEEIEEAYYDCRKHKRGKKSSLEYELNYELNNFRLWQELNNGTYEISTCVCFYVTRPKLREVFCANFRDRIVHHLIMRKFLWLFESEMIEDSYNCRIGKGVLYGISRIKRHIEDVSENYTREAWCLCIDLKGFFMSIDRDILWGCIEDTVRRKYDGGDIEWWLLLMKKVVYNRPELNCEIRGDASLKDDIAPRKSLFHSHGKGLPIGNLTSQIFANFYMTMYDNWLCSQLGDNERYGRYVDDVRIIGTDKQRLLTFLNNSRKWLNENLKVSLHPNKVSLQSVHKGVPFIGSVIKHGRVYAGYRAVDATFGAVGDWNKDDKPNTIHYVQRLNSYFGFLVHCKSYAIRWRVWKGIKHKGNIYCYRMRKLKITNQICHFEQEEVNGQLIAEWHKTNEYELHKNNNP